MLGPAWHIELHSKKRLPPAPRLPCGIPDENTQSAVWCWHLSEHESAAMWRIYSHADEGVAVRSTFARLRTSLDAAPHRVMLGAVRYLDFQTQTIVMPHGVITFAPAFHKRNSYAYEQEVRALVWYPQQIEGQVTNEDKAGSGVVVPVNLQADRRDEGPFSAKAYRTPLTRTFAAFSPAP